MSQRITKYQVGKWWRARYNSDCQEKMSASIQFFLHFQVCNFSFSLELISPWHLPRQCKISAVTPRWGSLFSAPPTPQLNITARPGIQGALSFLSILESMLPSLIFQTFFTFIVSNSTKIFLSAIYPDCLIYELCFMSETKRLISYRRLTLVSFMILNYYL